VGRKKRKVLNLSKKPTLKYRGKMHSHSSRESGPNRLNRPIRKRKIIPRISSMIWFLEISTGI
jgi:hypothetical protein